MKIFKILTLVIFVSVSAFTLYDGKDDIDNIRNNDISKEEIYQHIKYLSSDELEGRFPGTPGDSLTNSYLAGEFVKYGLDPAGENGYMQPFEIYTHVRLSGDNKFSIFSDGNEKNYTVEEDFLPLGFSGNGIAQGELVFLGYGISAPEQNYDDYKDKNGNEIDIAGKILVIMKDSPGGADVHNNPFQKYEQTRFKTLSARDGNAAGIILISGPNAGDDKISKMKYDNVLQNEGIPIINCKREIIENIFRQKGLDLLAIQNKIDSTKKPDSFTLNDADAVIETNVEPVKVITQNIVGIIEGSDPVLKNEVIVIGAHKDHLGYGLYGSLYAGNDKQIHNGADDNASGTAGMLELAQKFSSERKDLRRSILFIGFGAEEAGLLGSSYFTKSKLFEDKNIVAMINMDMVGRLSDNKLIIYGTGTSSIWDPLIDSINNSFNFNITKTPDGFGPSDHSSFYAKNMPVLHFFTGTHSDYHSPTDDVEKINSEGEAMVLNMVYDIAMTLDEMENKPDFIKVVSTDNEKRSMGNVKVYVGTIPDYSSTEEGMKLAGVKEGSPADKGGLQAEDLIIKFGSKDVKNIYDYMYAMGEFKPGEEAEVTVIRKNEKVVLMIKLGSR
ncbi:MAG TPA: M20/M25/M40 family metallo-hydrolase [Ignavibacteria bacterium]|nr:M20/M25/M40 family metallo-hydrolase [Ignavibacteria bacterium]HMR38922.1 M20/M25/M40 family metallo-hydrolase [Ignavibacteria bacterium]